MIRVSLKQIPQAVAIGHLWIDGLCLFEKAKGKRFLLDGNFLVLKDVPNFASPRKWERWLKHHFPKRAIQRFLTTVLKKGKVKITAIE